MIYSYYAKNLSIDELVGPINAQLGAIDDLGVGDRKGGFIYAMGGDGRHVVKDDTEQNNAALRDVNQIGLAAAGGWRIETSNIAGATPLHRIGITEVQLEYVAETDFELVVEYSTDGGTTWSLYSTQTLIASDRPYLASVARWIERESIQFAVSTEASPHVRLIGLYVDSQRGGRIQDAR